ncbi:MAG: hypothetical protein K2P51_07250 [Rhabdochlamydiaceae bacterium]|nr:hypothetical protein [Rhabdochlamydiaceae bacterium]
MTTHTSLRRFFYLCATLCFTAASLNATTIDRSDDIEQKDINALREWINTKRQVTVRELGGALAISGEVRTEFQSTSETINGIQQRGPRGAARDRKGDHIPNNAYDIEVNLMFDYRTDRSWGSIKLEFDNNAGVFSGSLSNIKLERAYWGVRAIDADTFNFDIEAGRRRMSTMADSKIEFNSFYDGVWFKYDQSFDSIGDYFLHAGAFIINENADQYGYLGETGIYNVGGTGLYMKYSLVDWDTKHFDNTVRQHRFDFIVSQFILGYKWYPAKFQKIIQFYLAGLWNHRARKVEITGHKRANWGGYVGVSIGELKKQGDWAFDINYQVLAAQCVPDFDVQGIGLGNAPNTGFYLSDSDGKGKPNTRQTAGGNVNYRGFQMTLDYLLTNQLNMQQSWQQAVTLDDNIGPFRRFKQYEVEFIYGF